MTTTAVSKVWTNWHWPDDVRDFATRNGGEPYLEPLKQALARLYPTASVAKALFVRDPELRDVAWIVFEVTVAREDLQDSLAARDAWNAELFRICPAPKVWMFGLRLLD